MFAIFSAFGKNTKMFKVFLAFFVGRPLDWVKKKNTIILSYRQVRWNSNSGERIHNLAPYLAGLINKIRTIIMLIALLLFIFDFNSCFICSIVPIYNVSTATATFIVVFGTNLTSTVGIKFTRTQLAIIKLAPYQKSVIIGLILSDGRLTFSSKKSKNAILEFKQSLAHFQYVWFVFNILSHYCSSSPYVTTGIRAGNRFYGLKFFTRSMPCLTELHSLFFLNKVKIIPDNIYDLLTSVALAHLIMGDGQVASNGLRICTDAYSSSDIVKLINVLMIKYRLVCTIHVSYGRQRIYISAKSINLLASIIKPYMFKSMYYKIKS